MISKFQTLYLKLYNEKILQKKHFYKIYVKFIEYFLFFISKIKEGWKKDKTLILAKTLKEEKYNTPQTIKSTKKLLVLIPFRDKMEITKTCLKTLKKQKKDFLKIRTCLIDNNSKKKKTLDFINKYIKENISDTVLLKDSTFFNYSRLNNFAVKSNLDFSPDYLLFLNNDIEFQESRTLEAMVSFLEDNLKVAACGSTLLYPDHRIQHLFLAPGVKLGGAHPLKTYPFDSSWQWFQKPRKVPAITGALMLVRASSFHKIHGFDENLATSCQDMDLCLRLAEKNEQSWVLPQLIATHHETQTRKAMVNKEELTYFYKRWEKKLNSDEIYPRKLSRWSEKPIYSLGEGAYPWKKILGI